MVNIFRGPRGSCQEEDTLAAALLADCVGWFTIQDSKHTALVSMGFLCVFLYTIRHFLHLIVSEGEVILNLLLEVSALKCQPSNAHIV